MPKTINLEKEAKRMNNYAKKLLESGELFEMTRKACEIADINSILYVRELDEGKLNSRYVDKLYHG